METSFYLWSAIAGLTAVTIEYFYRTHDTYPIGVLPLIVILQGSLFMMFRASPTWMVGTLAFALATLGFRAVLSHFLVGENILERGNLIAFVGLIAMNIITKVWK